MEEDKQAKGKDGKDTIYLGILYGALGRFIGIPVLIWIVFLVAVLAMLLLMDDPF